jgi:SAM-dependent methyltransferase
MRPARDHFAAADAAHFHWTTTDPGFAPVEEALLAPRLAALAVPCLEVGCGEGTNLVRLARQGRPFGVDRSVGRVRFAARAVPGAQLAAADAGALPFRDGVFASVLIRDLLHHVAEPGRAAAEAARVLAPAGILLVIEPNGRNPLVALQARLVGAERGLRTFTQRSVLAALDGLPFVGHAVEMAQGLPLRRLVLHYRFGWPALGRAPAVTRILERLERLGERLLPPARWSYIVVRCRRR